jgi:hypothetical protein
MGRCGAEGPDRWAEFAGWYLSDDPDPPISPYSHMLRSQLAKKRADDREITQAPASSDATDDGRGGNPNIKLRDFLPPGTLVFERGATAPERPLPPLLRPRAMQHQRMPPCNPKAEPEAAMPAKGAYHVQVGAFLQKSEADKHITLVATRAGDLVRDHAPTRLSSFRRKAAAPNSTAPASPGSTRSRRARRARQ